MGRITLTAIAAAIAVNAVFCLNLSASDYRIVNVKTESIDLPLGELQMTETVVQQGPAVINRFTMHRLRRPGFPVRGTLLLLPSLGNNFRMYLTNEHGDPASSFAAVFVRLGYEVWGYSPRTSFLRAGDCGAAVDCSAALNWNLQTTVDDVTFVRSRIAAVLPGRRTVIGGLSMGAAAALAVVNRHPEDYAGLLAWEGSLVTDDPAIRFHNQGFCTQFTGLVGAGIAVDDQSLPFVKLVNQLARTAPNDPFVIPAPGFPPGLTNRQAWLLILTTPNPVAPSPRPGFISAAGNFMTGQLFYSDDARLAASIAVFDDVTANAVSRDLYCSLAGVETAYVDNLKQFTSPVIVIQGGQGFGSVMDELPGKLGSTSVTRVSHNAFGHVDHNGTSAHWLVLELPIALWLSHRF